VPLPPDDGRQVDDADAWVERTAAELADALADPAVRAEVLALLDGHERDRARRLAAARAELAGLEVRWRLEEAWEA
jgi:predicted nucleic acid-binding protein